MQKPSIDDLITRDVSGLLRAVAECQAACVTMLTRTHFDPQAGAIPAAGAFVALCFWTIGTRSLGIELFAFLWFVALLTQRGRNLVDAIKGRESPLRAAGYPYLTAFLCPHEWLARLMEGALVLAAGVVMVLLSWSLGHLLMASGAAILFLEGSHGAGREDTEAGTDACRKRNTEHR